MSRYLYFSNPMWVLLLSLSAHSADYVISSDTTSQQILSDGDTLMVNENINLESPGGATGWELDKATVYADERDDVSITNHGIIHADSHYAIRLDEGVNSKVINHGTISAGFDDGQHNAIGVGAVTASGTTDFELINNGTIFAKHNNLDFSGSTDLNFVNNTSAVVRSHTGIALFVGKSSAHDGLGIEKPTQSATLTNYGEIISDEHTAVLIQANDNTTLTNYHKISGDYKAIDASLATNAHIINHGEITGESEAIIFSSLNSDYQYLSTFLGNNKVSNHGSIHSSNNAVVLNSKDTLVNTGSITAAGNGVHIHGRDNVVDNYGSINNIYIDKNGDNRINNYGALGSSVDEVAVNLNLSDNNTLSLLPGSSITGSIHFYGGTDNVLAVGIGPGISYNYPSSPALMPSGVW